MAHAFQTSRACDDTGLEPRCPALPLTSTCLQGWVMYPSNKDSVTYGHSQLKTGHPVRSAIHKQLNGRLVLRWVTTWESLLLYVLLRDLFAIKQTAEAFF